MSLTAAQMASGIKLNNVEQALITQCQLVGITSFNEEENPTASHGIEATSVHNCTIQSCLVQNIGTTTNAIGIKIDGSTAFIDDCNCFYISGEEAGLGFQLLNTVYLVQDCEAQDIAATTTAIGYMVAGNIYTTISNLVRCRTYICQSQDFSAGFCLHGIASVIDTCVASAVQATNLATGFFVDGDSNIVTQNSQALLLASFTGDVRGFLIDGSDMELLHCDAQHMFGLNSVMGFSYNNGARGTLQNCTTGYLQTTSVGEGYHLDSSAALAQNCRAFQLGGDSIGCGFRFTTAANQGALLNCVVHGVSGPTAQGVLVEGSNIQVDNTFVKDTTTGIELATTASNCTIAQCIVENTVNGIVDNGTNSVVCDCFAAHNTTNYTGVPAPLIVTPGGTPVACGNISA
jgi:hypothetical protein